MFEELRSPLAAEVRRLAAPAILHSLLLTLVFVVDRIMLGQHGDTSLAAMQIAGPIEWSTWSVFASFEVGTIARVGRHVGAGRLDAARLSARLSLGIALAMGAVVAALGPLLTSHLGMLAKSASPPVLSAASDYLGVTLLASPAVFLLIAAAGTLQAGGDTRTPLVVGAVANALHVPLNRVLILGGLGIAPMGARGCAISTAATFTLEALLLVVVLLRPRKGRVSLRVAEDEKRDDASDARTFPATLAGTFAATFAAAFPEARALFDVAGPAVLERVLYHAGFLGFAFLIGQLGDRAMAANQALLSAESVCFLSADGFGIAAAALVAQKLGAKKPDEAERSARVAALYGVVTLSLCGVVLLLFRGPVLGLFSNDVSVVAVGAAAVPLLAMAQPFMASGIVLGQALRGGGFTREVLVVTTVCAVFVRLVATHTFAIRWGLGLNGVWLGSTCDWLFRTALLVAVVRMRLRVAKPGALDARAPS